MIFNNLRLRHAIIYLFGIIALVAVNIHQLQQFQSEVVRKESTAKNTNNRGSETVYYIFISEYGSCDLERLDSSAAVEVHKKYAIKQSERPCTVQNYYVLGKGLLFLLLIPAFLLLFPLFSGSNVNQRIYNRAFYISLSTILLAVLNVFYEIFFNPPPRDYVPRFNPFDLLTWGGLIVYLCFFLNGWGKHRENLLKFLLVTATMALPIAWISIAMVFSFTT